MITRAYEFEIVKDDEWYVALPYDLESGTQAKSFDELCEMVSDWLKVTLEQYDMDGQEPPKPTYGNSPRFGGRNMVFGCSAGRETVAKVSATEAARLLDVTPGRITQMLSSGLLTGWREGRNTWVTIDSIKARLEEKRHVGRPTNTRKLVGV